MSRLIDADKLLEEMRVSGRAAYLLVQDAPTINPDDLRPRGRWIDLGKNYYTVVSKCSECGAKYDFRSLYCPNCGARMEE